MGRMNVMLIVGVILVVVGLLGFVFPVFTTQKTEDVVRIGALKIQNTQDTPHTIPPLLSGGVLVLGTILIGTSRYKKR